MTQQIVQIKEENLLLKRSEKDEQINMTNEIKELSDKNDALERQISIMSNEKEQIESQLKEKEDENRQLKN